MPKKDTKVKAKLAKPKTVQKKTKTSTRVVRELSPPAYNVKQNAVDSKPPISTTHKLIIGNATSMPDVSDESVQLMVTSPPYFNAPFDYKGLFK